MLYFMKGVSFLVSVIINRFFEICQKWLFDRLCGESSEYQKAAVIPFAFLNKTRGCDKNDYKTSQVKNVCVYNI